MQLKVLYGEELRVFYVDRREDTYESLLSKVMQEFFGDATAKKVDNFRLRAYNVQYKIPLETYSNRAKETLEVLKIYPMKTLMLEEKEDDQVFEEYDPNKMIVKVNFWRAGLQSLAEDILEPVHVKVSKDAPMKDLIKILATNHSEQCTSNEANIIVMKRNPMMNVKQIEVLSE